MATNKKPVAVSGAKPSGELQLGNYLGAIKQFPDFQEHHQSYFFIVDLHAITVPQDPALLHKRTLDIAMLYLACGLDPAKTTLFVQSHVPEHAELGWILNTLTPLGELERMTQYKDYVQKRGKEGILAGLLNYPTLMAADILLYNPDVVPVGEDQAQHVELTRTLARKFNNRFGDTFKEPKAIIQKEGARIMSLDNPLKKMSKSDESTKGYIEMLDPPETIKEKIKSAVTDSEKEIKYDPEKKPAISNLLTIYSLLADISIPELESQYSGKSYADFKSNLADVVVKALEPIQTKYYKLARNPDDVLHVLEEGAQKAQSVAALTMHMVRERVGLIEKGA